MEGMHGARPLPRLRGRVGVGALSASGLVESAPTRLASLGTLPRKREREESRGAFDFYVLKKLFAASFDTRFLVVAACSLSISDVISAMRSASSSTDNSDRSCPISWVTFFLGLSSSSAAMCSTPCSTLREAVASASAAG